MKRKKVLIISPPFSGHLHPLIGLGLRISAIADVTVLSTPSGVKDIEASGLPARSMMAEHEPTVLRISQPGHAVKNNPFRLFAQLKSNVALMAHLKKELEAIYRTEKPDLVIADFVVPVAGFSAMRVGIPWWTTIQSPCVIETPDGPPGYFNGQIPARTALQRLKHAAMRWATRRFKHLVWQIFRREFLTIGFQGIYRCDGSESVYSPQRILALGLREIEFACTWPSVLEFVGPSLHTPPYHGPSPLFPDDGRPCVLVTIGTHLIHAKTALSAVIQEIAIKHPGIMFHFTHGNVNASVRSLRENFHEYAYISYAEHLPRYSAVVHHAGTGIMNHCLRHGLPAVVYPLDFDQFDYAVRLVAAGVALAAHKLTDLESAILRALTDEALKTNCEKMSRIVSNYQNMCAVDEMLLEEFQV